MTVMWAGQFLHQATITVSGGTGRPSDGHVTQWVVPQCLVALGVCLTII